MDEEDEEQRGVELDDLCTWMAEHEVELASRPPSVYRYCYM